MLHRTAGLSAYFALPSEHPTPNHRMGPSVVFAVVSTHPAGLTTQASPRMRRLAAPSRRNGFVILQAVRSLPAALHPALLRRSCLQLHVSRLHIGRTLTLLTKQHHRRTHSRECGNPETTSLAESHPFRPRRWAPTCAAASWPLDTRFRGYDKLNLAKSTC